MSWSTRRRIMYIVGVLLFFGIVLGGPVAYKLLTIAPTCSDGIQNQGETSIDHGGPCPLLDASALSPTAVLWARSFKVRTGSYNSVAYIENPNQSAGVARVQYRFRLYDADNVLVTDREGITYVMPGGITPVFEGGVDTGSRDVARTYFEFLTQPVWQQMNDATRPLQVGEKKLESADSSPRLTASVVNSSVAPLFDVTFTAVAFDTAGNAFAASATHVSRLGAGESTQLVFTWPTPFSTAAARIDIIPLVVPAVATSTQSL